MGGLTPSPREGWVAWTGGQPKADWTGLEATNAGPTSQNQYRPFSGQKSLAYRRQGLESKYKAGDDLVSFKTNIWKRLTDDGQSAIAYLPDPATHVMMNVVENHPRFTVKYAKHEHQTMRPSFDSYDIANDGDAIWMFLGSLTDELRIHLERKRLATSGFVEIWLMFIDKIQSRTLIRFEKLKKDIKDTRASMFAGENLAEMCKVYTDIAKELVTAGYYEHQLTLDMVRAFQLSGGGQGQEAANRTFHTKLSMVEIALEGAMTEIQFLDKRPSPPIMQTPMLGRR
jgi:hypothetical protein